MQQEAGASLTERLNRGVTTIVGMDLSSRKLAAIGHTEEFGWFKQTWEAPKKEKDRAVVLEQFIEPFKLFVEHLAVNGPVWFFIENPVVGRGGPHPTIVQAQVQGLVLGLSLHFGASGAYPVNVQTWKKDIVGKGNSSKSDVQSWLEHNHPSLFELADGDGDCMDAACIALYGQAVISRSDKFK